MKHVYFVQINDVYDTQVKSVYFPYAVGCIEAYCKASKLICDHYEFGKILYYRMEKEEFLERIADPFAVFFSCSVWNYEYNKVMAREIKSRYPACAIIFGGHSVSADAADLEEQEFVDFLVHSFGEETTEKLLAEFIGQRDFASVPGLSFRNADGSTVTTKCVPQTGTDYPSPYLTGVFDDLMDDGFHFSAIMETNRGCPHACAYCDWSSLKSRVRLFPMERVKAELDWFVEHKIEYIYCADGNFCLFERDREIAEYVVACKKKYGYPKIFRVFFAKNKVETVHETGMLLMNNGLDKVQTISFQSMNEEVLKNIGRKNISNEMFKELMKKYSQTNIATSSELILGLPGETYDSFCAGINTLLNCGQHFSFMVYPCELLPNSAMAQKSYREQYGIKTTRIPFRLVHSASDIADAVTEYGEYVTSTYSMTEEDWIRSLIFAKYVQGLHSIGLLRAIALFFRYEYGIQYDVFYNRFLAYSAERHGGVLNLVYRKIYRLCQGILQRKNEFVTTHELTGKTLWDMDEFIFLESFSHLDAFYAEVGDFIRTIADSEVLDELLRYQKGIVKKIGCQSVEIVSAYDFYEYFNDIYADRYAPLKKQACVLRVVDKNPVFSFEEYAKEVVWFGRSKHYSDYSSSYYDAQFELL